MSKDVPQNQTEIKEQTIDHIARFLILAARDLRQREKEKLPKKENSNLTTQK